MAEHELTPSLLYRRTVNTADGPFSIVTDENCVLASGWTDDLAELVGLIHPRLREGADQAARGSDAGILGQAVDAVEAYYEGECGAVAAVAVKQVSGPFREHAWEVLRGVPTGTQLTYTQYAERAGSPAAVRAAAGACARNAAALFVPCHRIIRSDGSLGGFRYGLDIKRSLLQREQQ